MKNILLIEDDPTISRNIKESLTEEGNQIEVVFDGFIAEKLLKKNEYDCIILDVNLPGKNGYEVCKSFRQYNTHTPVLMLTAFSELEDKVQGYESGIDDYLTKPFFMKELILRIHSLIKRNEHQSNTKNSDTLIADDIIISIPSKKVTRQDKEVILTPREYHILVKLIEKKGEYISKKEIINEIWNTDDANTNTVEVYINFLRNKIDKPFGKQSIKTKVGFGYCFSEE